MKNAHDIRPSQDHTKLKGELLGISANGQFASINSRAGFASEQVAPLLLDASDLVMDASGATSNLDGGGDEEAPTREDAPLDVGEVALTKGKQALAPRLGRLQRRGDDLEDEAVACCVDGRQLELFLGAEECVDAALGNAGGVGQSSDRDPFDSLDSCQLGCLLHDAGACAPPGPGFASSGSPPRPSRLPLDRRPCILDARSFIVVVRSFV